MMFTTLLLIDRRITNETIFDSFSMVLPSHHLKIPPNPIFDPCK
jgi:hypothetical protein